MVTTRAWVISSNWSYRSANKYILIMKSCHFAKFFWLTKKLSLLAKKDGSHRQVLRKVYEM